MAAAHKIQRIITLAQRAQELDGHAQQAHDVPLGHAECQKLLERAARCPCVNRRGKPEIHRAIRCADDLHRGGHQHGDAQESLGRRGAHCPRHAEHAGRHRARHHRGARVRSPRG